MRLKKLSSMREKKRYIIFKIHSSRKIIFSNAHDAIFNSLENWLGEEQLARARVKIFKNLWDAKKQTGFLRCSHLFVDKIKVGLALIHQIGDEKVVFQTLCVAGTIKSGKKSTN